MAKDFYDPTETNHRIGFSLVVDPKKKRTNIKIKLSQLKFFVMPHVFKDVSEFALQALQKLDLKKLTQEQFQKTVAEEEEEAKRKQQEALGSRTFIKVNVTESILVLERRERSKKAIVTEMDFGVKLSTIDQLTVEQEIARQKIRHTGSNKNKFRIVTRMVINCNKVQPYMVNIKELEGNSFRSIKKRLIMTGLSGKLKTLAMVGKWENPNAELLEGEQPVVKFKNKNEIDIGMTAFSFNVSMDDFYVITSISRKIVEEGLELAKIWTDYAVNDVVSDEFKDYKKETAVYPETQVDITADGAELVIINEEKGNFVPLFMTKVEGIKFSMADGVIEDTMEFYGDTGFSVYYFNQNSGYWEPAVEPVLLNAKF